MGRFDHRVPKWVKGTPEFFLTICCKPRGHNQLCSPSVAKRVFESVRYYQETGTWWPDLVLLMPDHVHALLSVRQDLEVRKVVGAWKRYLNREMGIAWQKNFFDHRLRSEDSAQQKWSYILENPLRAGLVQSVEDWDYVRFAHE